MNRGTLARMLSLDDPVSETVVTDAQLEQAGGVPVVEQVYDELAPQYDGAFLGPEALAENVIAFEKSYSPHYPRVLDVGCGTALFLEYCNPDVYLGTDISEGMLEVARRKFPNRSFLQADMADMPSVRSKNYDQIVSTFGSFSYCLTPMLAAKEMLRVLCRGGWVNVMALSHRYPGRKSHIARHKVPFIGWHASPLADVFRAAGFRYVSVVGLNAVSGAFGNRLGKKATEKLMRFEHNTLGRWYPDACYYLCLRGVRH